MTLVEIESAPKSCLHDRHIDTFSLEVDKCEGSGEIEERESSLPILFVRPLLDELRQLHDLRFPDGLPIHGDALRERNEVRRGVSARAEAGSLQGTKETMEATEPFPFVPATWID